MRKKGWKEWRWINPFPCRLDGANSCWSCHHEKASSSQLGVTFLVGWGDPSFKCQSWRPTAPPSLQSIPVSGVLSTSSPCFFSSIRNTIYGFLDHRQLMQNVSKIQFEMEIRIWADLIWILLIQQCIQMIFSFAGPNPKRLYKSLYIIISALQIFISKPLMLILALLTAYLKYIFFNYEDTKVFC